MFYVRKCYQPQKVCKALPQVVQHYAGRIVRPMNLYFYWSLIANVVVCVNAKAGTTLNRTWSGSIMGLTEILACCT